MKKILFVGFLLLSVFSVRAQVGIGTPIPSQSSQLDVVASDKGVLLPRVRLMSTTDQETITNGNVSSLLVFNIMEINDVTPGYYYWYNSKWNRLGGEGASDETITTLINNGAGVYTYTSEDGTLTEINVTQDVLDDILNQGAIYSAILDLIGNQGTQGDQIITVLQDNNDGTYTYYNENEVDAQGNITGTGVTIDIPNSVIHNFEQIINGGPVVINGNTYNTIEEYLESLGGGQQTLTVLNYDENTHILTYLDENEAIHLIELNASTLVSEIDGDTLTLTYTNEKGEVTTVDLNKTGIAYDMDSQMLTFTNLFGEIQMFDIGMLIEVEQTLTVLTYDEGTHTLSYMDEHEVTHQIELNASTLVSEIDGDTLTLTYTNEKGEITTVDLNKTGIAYDMDSQMLTFTNLFGETQMFDIGMLIEVEQTLTVLTYDEDTHTLSYFDEHEVTHQIELNASTLVSEIDGDTLTLTYTNEKGEITTIDLNKTGIAYDMDSQMLTFTNLFGETQVFDIGMLIDMEQTLTVLTYDEGTHTLSYMDEHEVTHQIELNASTLVSEIDGDTMTLTYTNEKGEITTVDLNKTGIAYDMDSQMLTFTNLFGETQVFDIGMLIEVEQTLTVLTYDEDTHTLSYFDEHEVTHQIELNASTLVSEIDGDTMTLTYTNEKGETTTVDLNKTGIAYDMDSQMLTFTNLFGETQVFDIGMLIEVEQTLTVLTYDEDTHTLSYFDEHEVTHQIELNASTLVSEIDGDTLTLTYTNEKGETTTIDLNKTGIAYDMDSQMLTFTNLFGETQMFDIGMLIEAEQTLTVLTYDSTNHTFIYKDEDEVEHEYALNFGAVYYDSAGSKDIFLYKNARGEETRVEYDNSNGILAFYHEGNLIVKYDLVEFVRDNQSLTSLNYDNSTHTLSYVDEKGDQYQIPLNAGQISMEKQGSIDKYIYSDAHGNKTTMQYNNANGIFKIFNDEGLSNEYDFVEFVRQVQTLTKLEEGSNASLVYTDEKNDLVTIKSVMPKFFYMPPTSMPTDAAQLPLAHVSESGGVFTVDLYGMYAEQFGGTNSTSSASNPGQTASLPVLPASELDYNITYFNNAIFTNVSVSNAGILTYQIAPGANTDGAYMNIVFAVK